MSELTLLVMAGGSSTRYGRLKQTDPLGPTGETLVEYSIFDALKSGFKRVVFVLRRDIEEQFHSLVGKRLSKVIDVEYVFQDEFLLRNANDLIVRKKPWGTAHAVLSASDVIEGPFAVINSDDYYGVDSFRMLGGYLASNREDSILVGFALRNALSPFGTVARGICKIGLDSKLESVTETHDIEADGFAVKYRDSSGLVHHLTGDETVSMNMWGFREPVFDVVRERWNNFVQQHGRSTTAEFYIPDVVTDCIQWGKIDCQVVKTPDSWFGITHPDDRRIAIGRLGELIASGTYPRDLWS